MSLDADDVVVASRRPRRWIIVLFGVATAVYLIWLVVSRWSQIDRAVLRFQGAGTRWLLGAAALEVCSQGCMVGVQHRLLRRAGSTFRIRATTRLVLAQNAIAMAVPGGQAVASVFSYRQIRRRGANSSAALWVVAASNLVGMLALATFGAFTATGTSWATVVSAALLAVALVVLVVLARAPARLVRPASALVRVVDVMRRRTEPQTSATQRVEDRLARLSTVHLRWSDWLVIGLFAVAAVAADCAVWISASHAMIALPARCLRGPTRGRVAQQCAAFRAPSTAGLLVAYSAGQAALQLPLLPGGIGLVESVMTAALTTSKIRAIQALSAVLLYRLISFWSVAVLGALMVLSFRRSRLRGAMRPEEEQPAL